MEFFQPYQKGVHVDVEDGAEGAVIAIRPA
jgi:hypothetical protein